MDAGGNVIYSSLQCVHNFQYNLTSEFSGDRKKWYDCFERTEESEIISRFFNCAQEERRDTERSDINRYGTGHWLFLKFKTTHTKN